MKIRQRSRASPTTRAQTVRQTLHGRQVRAHAAAATREVLVHVRRLLLLRMMMMRRRLVLWFPVHSLAPRIGLVTAIRVLMVLHLLVWASMCQMVMMFVVLVVVHQVRVEFLSR